MLFWRGSRIRRQTAICTLNGFEDRNEGERKMESLAVLFLYSESWLYYKGQEHGHDKGQFPSLGRGMRS